MATAQTTPHLPAQGETQGKSEKVEDVRTSNIHAAKAIANMLRSSLGPKGLDKLIETAKSEVIITNDGATILQNLSVLQPSAKLLIQVAKAQDVEAGDGTTTVVVLAGALLEAAEGLLRRGIHPSQISEGFADALRHALDVVDSVAHKIDAADDDQLLQCVKTSLASKIVSQNATEIAPLALEAAKRIADLGSARNLDLRDIKLVKKIGGTLEDSELVSGLIFPDNRPSNMAGGPLKVSKPRIAVLQFCLSAPKTDVESQIAVSDYTQIDRVLREERQHVLELVKKIANSGATVVLVQKSILREGVSELALHFLAKKKIMVVRDIERTDVEFVCKTLKCTPIAHPDSLKPEKLGTAESAEEVTLSNGAKVLRIDVREAATATILLRGAAQLVVDEAERSVHDALCVIRSLVKNKGVVGGGGSIEIEVARALEEKADRQEKGSTSLVLRAYAEALETIPFVLAENCGLNALKVVTEMRNKHKRGLAFCGLKARTGLVVDNTFEHKIMQPALVTISALTLATEVTRMILKIDDILQSR